MLCCSLLFSVQQHTAPWKTNSTPSWSSFYLHIYVSHHHTNTSEGNPLKDTMQLQNNGFIYEGEGGKNKFQIFLSSNNCSHWDFHGALGDSEPLSSAELFQLDYGTLEGFGAWTAPLRSQQLDSSLSLDWTLYFVFNMPVWVKPAEVFCCRTQVFFSLRQWSDGQMFSISIFRYTESQCLVPPDHHSTSMYDWWNSAEAQWFWLRFSPMLPFLPNFFMLSHEFWPYLRPVCFNII